MRGLARRLGFIERGVFLQGVLFPARVQMGGRKFSKSLLCFGSIWKKASSALAKCLLGGRCDVSCLSRRKRSGERGLGLGKEQVAYSWASKDTCFPGDRWTVWKIVTILLNSTKGGSPGEVRTKGRRLWGECWRQELHGWSCRICVEELWVLRRIHDDLTHTQKKPPLGCWATWRTLKAKLLQKLWWEIVPRPGE